MEGVADRDPTLQALPSFQTPEVAYAMLIGVSGEILFHSNPDLIGTTVGDTRYRSVLGSGILGEERIRLGTGEQVYEFQQPFHLSGKTCVLRIALHTWRAETVLRRARFGTFLIFSLLALGWALGAAVFWLLRRQEDQEKLLAHQNELARLGEVGAVLAHEVRNPLAGIKGYGQLLEERLPDGAERGFARLIVGESVRMEALVNDIQLYTRSEPQPHSVCPLAAIVSSICELVELQAEEAEIQLVNNIPSDLMALCPEEGIRRVLLNLITNALQALPCGGRIVVSGMSDGTSAKIFVADNGPGISPEMLPVLFEPFRTSKARGAGLGLAVCRKIIEGCGGTISVESTPGGACFFINVPLSIKDETS
jgi:two-component system sensor histidine kinase HydH